MPDLSFGTSLVGEQCHQSLVNLGEGEIKTIENFKTFLSKQVNLIENYCHGMQRLNTSCDISKFGYDEDSPFVKAWKVFHIENIQVLSTLNQLASNLSLSIMPRLDKLLGYVKEAHKQYKSNRFRIDSELKRACDQEGRLRATYRQHAEELESAKQKLESGKAKVDKAKQDKVKKVNLKLFQNHNDYILAIEAASIHQNHYQSAIIPNLMNSLQSVKEDLVNEWKNILMNMSENIKTYAVQCTQLADALSSSMNKIKEDNPYEPFIVNKGSAFDPHPGFVFDEELLSITTTDLIANEIEVNELTFEQLKTKNMLLDKAVSETKSKLNMSSTEYQATKQVLNGIRGNVHDHENLGGIFTKQMAVADLSRELKELSCSHEKAVAQKEIIRQALDKIDGEPKAINDPPPSANSISKRKSLRIPLPTRSKVETNHLQGSSASDNFSSNPLRRPLPTTPRRTNDNENSDDEVDEYDEPVEAPLENETWYHGMISRQETEEMLRQNGDFLVRESSKKPGSYVLSVQWGGLRHFIILQDEPGKYRLEGEAYATVTHLIDYHRKQQCEVTRKTGALLKNAIARTKSSTGRNLKHDDVIVETKLGRGHFGDVMKGRLRTTGEQVAVKTCRDNVLPTMKDKFLQEAAILAQYSHPNIVKLIGFATDKEPVYIVMELMPGGDFLNYLRKHGGDISSTEMLQYCIDAASGMKYLEGKGCIHRDLAARNCLLDKKKVLKISDFGMSRETDIYQCSNMREIPVKWTAPEALNYSQYTSASDVWSFGVLLWETYSLGNTPYPGKGNKDTREQVDKGYRMPPPAGTPPAIYQVMMECWKHEPTDRPTFSALLVKLKKIQQLPH